MPAIRTSEAIFLAALTPVLVARLFNDGGMAGERLTFLALAIAVSFFWALVFSFFSKRPLGEGILPYPFALTVLVAPNPEWGPAIFTISAGAVLGREIFGGRAVIPPVAVALTLGIFSFPHAGLEQVSILFQVPDYNLLAAAGIGFALLAWRGEVEARVIIGTLLGLWLGGIVLGDDAWWEHLAIGALAPGLAFVAAMKNTAPSRPLAAIFYGIALGWMVIMLRLNGGGGDGVGHALLLAALFSPLLDRLARRRAANA